MMGRLSYPPATLASWSVWRLRLRKKVRIEERERKCNFTNLKNSARKKHWASIRDHIARVSATGGVARWG